MSNTIPISLISKGNIGNMNFGNLRPKCFVVLRISTYYYFIYLKGLHILEYS